MKFARRYDSVRKNLTQMPKRRSARGQYSPQRLLDVLEPRVLLSATGQTVTAAWGGQLYEVAANQYVVQANAATAAALQDTLNRQGLHVTNTYKLADGFFVTTDEVDTVAQVEKWTYTHVTTTSSNVLPFVQGNDSPATAGPSVPTPQAVITALQPNFVSHKAATVPDELNGAVVGSALSDFLITNEFKNIGLYPSNYVPGSAQAVNGPNAWDLTTGSSDVVIAEMDTGISQTSLDTASQIWTNPGELAGDGIDNDGNGVIDDVHGADFSNVATDGTAVVTPAAAADDAQGHGTFIASIIGGVANNVTNGTTGTAPTSVPGQLPTPPTTGLPTDGGVGVAWHVTLLPVIVFTGNSDTATDAAIIAGLDYIRTLKNNGVNITAVNMSFARNYLGPASGIGDAGNIPATNNNGTITPGGDPPAISVFDAMKRVTDKGIIIVTAAGNAPGSTEDPNGPVHNITGGNGVNIDVSPFVPASAAKNNPMVITVTGSNALDQHEPTANWGPQTCTIAAPASMVWQSDTGDATGYSTGTSYSAALVSGAIALIKAFRPGLSGQQIVSLLYQGADKVAALTPYAQQGRRLNILNSLELLVGNPKPIGSVDQINAAGIAGWFFDQNLGAAQSPEGGPTLQLGAIVIDGVQVPVQDDSTGQVSNTFNFRFDRPDLFNAVGSTMHGFSIHFNQFLTPGPHTIQLYYLDTSIDPTTGKFLTNADGSLKYTPILVFTKVINGNQPPTGLVEVHTAQQISGYATDANLNNGEYIQVQINVDGQQVAIVDANQARTDAVGNHGFIYTPALAPGAHKVDVFALDNFDHSPVLLGSFTIVAQGNVPKGVATYDKNARVVTGYVIDPDSGFDPLSIQMVVDGANGSRQYFDQIANLPDANGDTEVPVSQPHNTNHGFRLTMPNLSPGNHQIKFFTYDRETGAKIDFLTQVITPDKATIGAFDLPLDPTQITGTVYDPDDVTKPVLYRLDFDNSTGVLATANLTRTDLGLANNNHGFSVVPPQLSAGQHTVRLVSVDNETLATRTVATANFTVVGPTLPTGGIDTFTANGITGYAVPPTAGGGGGGGGGGTLTVGIYVDGDETAPVLFTPANLPHTTNPNNNNGFQFTRNQITTTLSPGRHQVEVWVLGGTAGSFTQTMLLQEGELTIAGTGSAPAGTLTAANFTNIAGAVAGPVTDPNPEFILTVANPAGNSPSTIFLSGTLTPTPGVFSFPTPPVSALNNNTARLSYFDPITGNLTLLATQAIPATNVNTFINGTLIISGNNLPTGSLDAASQNGFGGWIRDPDTTNPIQYRIDIDNNTGMLQTGTLTRTDLPFADKNHGFSIVPPAVDIPVQGGHTAKLYAYDPNTGQAILIASRQFVVTNDANQRPTGAVEILDAHPRANGQQLLQGYAIDPTVRFANDQLPAAPLTFQVVVDGTVNSFTTNPNWKRTDLAKVTVADGNSFYYQGFGLDLKNITSNGVHFIQVYIVDSSDPTRKTLLIAKSVEVGPSNLTGNIDVANFDNIAGWVNAPTNDAAPVFRVDINDQPVALITNPALTTENGFNLRRFTMATPPFAATTANVVKVYYINSLTGEAMLLTTLAGKPVQKNIGPEQALQGSFDFASPTMVAGWALSPDKPTISLTIQILIDDNPALTTTAALFNRPDLTGIRAGHAFEAPLPGLPSGQHKISVRVLDPVTGDFISLGVKSIVAP